MKWIVNNLDSSKQRMRLNKQISKIRNRLDAYVQAYNKVALSLGCATIDTTVNESTYWPWVSSGNNDNY